jgi:hypothetical protein
MLKLSLLANAVLVLVLFFVSARMRKRIVEEKCATFAGCMAAITGGLALEDVDKRFDAVSHGMASLYHRTDDGEAEMRFYLPRACMLRMFRNAAMADIGEHLRLLALQTASDDDEPGNRMLEYISEAQPGNKEPRDVWGDDGLAAANFVAEKKALNVYRDQLAAAPPIKLFG